MKWGFPKWQGGGVIINARSETASVKKMFRQPLMNKRCAVPCAGFFEWRQEGDRKQSTFPHTRCQSALYGGFYDTFGGEDAFLIITTQAGESMSPYHSRMPLILTPQHISQWLCDLDFALGFLQAPCEARLYASAV
jgi:putative SOS response-associated peptidase YedK